MKRGLRLGLCFFAFGAVGCTACSSLRKETGSADLENQLIAQIHIGNAHIGDVVSDRGGAGADVQFEAAFDIESDVEWPAGVDAYRRTPAIAKNSSQAIAIDALGPVGPTGRRCELSVTVPTHLDGKVETAGTGRIIVNCRLS